MLAVPLRLHESQASKNNSTACHETERDPIDYPSGSVCANEPGSWLLYHVRNVLVDCTQDSVEVHRYTETDLAF